MTVSPEHEKSIESNSKSTVELLLSNGFEIGDNCSDEHELKFYLRFGYLKAYCELRKKMIAAGKASQFITNIKEVFHDILKTAYLDQDSIAMAKYILDHEIEGQASDPKNLSQFLEVFAEFSEFIFNKTTEVGVLKSDKKDTKKKGRNKSKKVDTGCEPTTVPYYKILRDDQ